MRILITILFVIFCQDIFCQDTAKFTTGNEAAVTIYEVQQSADTINWQTVGTVQPGKSSYAYVIPSINNIYTRIHAKGVTDFYTAPIKMTVTEITYSATISNAVISTTWYTDKLTWVSTNESNINYYLIESTTGASWNQVTTVTPKGNSAYVFSHSRGWFSRKPKYRVSAVFKNSTPGPISIFK